MVFHVLLTYDKERRHKIVLEFPGFFDGYELYMMQMRAAKNQRRVTELVASRTMVYAEEATRLHSMS